MTITKAVIPAAGLGTRFLPATKAQPKEMLPIVDKPTIQYIIEEAVASGITDILIITGRNKRAIEDHFDRSIELELDLEKKGKHELLKQIQEISELVNVQYVRQKNPLGLGHAIYCAKNFVGNESFAVMLGDDIVDAQVPCLKQLMEVYEQYQTTILGVQKVKSQDVGKYGIVGGETIASRTHFVQSMVEKPALAQAPSNIAILGRYIITPDIFPFLAQTAPGAGGEIQLTDALKELGKHKKVLAYEFEGRRYDVGDKQGFLEATVEMALQREDLKDEFLTYLKRIISQY